MSRIPKLYINPGHSDIDPGAVGYEVERELNVKVSNFQRDHLLANYLVEIRMSSGSVDSLTAVANDANAWGAELFVSNHFNAAGGDGFEAYIYSKKTTHLGEIFAKHVKAAGQNLRYPDTADMPMGVKVRPGLLVLKLTTMPAILTEGAFVDNLKDISDWNDDAELKKLGIAYAEACAEYMKLEKKVVEPKPVVPRISYRVQVGAFSKKANAERKMQAVQAAGFDAFVVSVDGKLWRVQVGAFEEKANAVKLQTQLQRAGFSGYVTTLSGEAVIEPKKTIGAIAQEVIRGDWGNGSDRQKKLAAAGYDYKAVQLKVNEILMK